MEGQYCTTNQGNKIYTDCWKPGGESPSAVVFIIHGYGEHSQHYEDIIPKLTDCNYVVFTHDHFGHGKSEGNLSRVDSINLFSNDAIFHIRNGKQLYPDLPTYLIGHSLGGLICLDIVLSEPNLVNGLILIAPALKASPELATPTIIRIGRLVARICPNFVMARLDSDKVTRNKDHIEKYSNDPLVFKEIRAKFGITMLDCQIAIENRLPEIKIPLLIMHGTDDQLTHISGSRILMEQASSDDKTYKEYKDAYHQLHHEPDGVGEEVIKLITDWINVRLS